MDFHKIYGHDNIKSILKNSIALSKISHAYIFDGPSGTGRFMTALAFAKGILCEDSIDGSPCGRCKSCLMAEGGTHPDLRIVSNQLYDDSSTSKDILVGTIREMKKEIYIKPFHGERKVYIIPKADTINETAQNSLLKVFEEPPPYCTVILIAENLSAFLETILSRALNIHFSALPKETVKAYLKANYEADDSLCEIRSAMSEGSIENAINLMESDTAEDTRGGIISALCALSSSSKKSLYEAILTLKKYSKDTDFMMKIITMWFRDCLYFKQGGAIVNLDKQIELESFCGSITDDAPFHLLDIAVRYTKYIRQKGKLSLGISCMMLECWEVLYDRDNWSKI